MVFSETLYLILTGTISAIAAWIIISAIKHIYGIIKDFTCDIKQIKKDVEELKRNVRALESKEVIKDE